MPGAKSISASILLMLCWVVIGRTTVAMAQVPPLASTTRPETIPDTHRTPQGLYVTAREAFAALQARPEILLIDVRTPGETVFAGLATPVTRNIPYVMLEDGHAFDAERRRYKLTVNPDFPKAVANLLEERKLGKDAVLILYCSVGERSAKAAALLANSGYTNVYSMVDGFEGEGGNFPGWRASGLPWGFVMTPDQAYHSPSF